MDWELWQWRTASCVLPELWSSAKWKLGCSDWTSWLSCYTNPVSPHQWLWCNCIPQQVFPIPRPSIACTGVRKHLSRPSWIQFPKALRGIDSKDFVKIILRNDRNCNIQSFGDQNYHFLVNSFRFIKHENTLSSIVNLSRCKLIN